MAVIQTSGVKHQARLSGGVPWPGEKQRIQEKLLCKIFEVMSAAAEEMHNTNSPIIQRRKR